MQGLKTKNRTRRPARSSRFALALFVSISLGSSLLAQEGAAQSELERARSLVDAPFATELRRYEGPQDVVKTFFVAMRAQDFDTAISTFEPGTFLDPALAAEAAKRLYNDVFLRTRRIDVSEEVPAQWSSDSFRLETYPESRPELRIVILLERVDGSFRFARESLLRIGEFAQLLEGVEISADVLGSFSTLEAFHHRLRSSLPAGLTSIGFLIENWQWFGLFVLTLLAVVIDRLTRFVLARFTVRVSGRENIRIDRDVLLSFERPTGLLVGIVVFEFLLPVLGIDAGVVHVLKLATSLIAAVAGVWAVYRLVDVLCDILAERAAKTENKFDDTLVPLARRTLKVFVAIVGILFVTARMSGDLWGIIAGLGLGSVAVAFAAKDSFENLFGTFTVLLDRPFQVGDWIIVGGLEGTVEAVGFRSTRIRTFYNSLITVPNREFISSSVDNMGERRYRRIRTVLSLTYDTPPEKIEAFCEGVRELIRSHPYTRKDYYHVYLNGFGASSLEVLLYCFVETPDWATELREKHRLFADVLRLAEGLNVSFAFPTQSLHMVKPEDLEHPDRPAGDLAGSRWGIEVANEVVRGSLAPLGGVGSVPPPVMTSTRPAFGDAGADGG